MNKPMRIILHIPHSSIRLPHYKGFKVSKEKIDNELLKLTDWYTDDLFQFSHGITVRAEFSRVFCDPERFVDDSQEVMAQFGMGVLYANCDDGSVLRQVDQNLRNQILSEYYWPHHERLNQAVQEQLTQHGKSLIVDCHSFPSTPFKRDLNQHSSRPDFNIGIDLFHTRKHLIELSKVFFQSKGYSLGIDWPYSGTIVPIEHYQKTSKVQSIMLEVNRALYLKEPSNEKSEDYEQVKELVHEYLTLIFNAFNSNY